MSKFALGFYYEYPHMFSLISATVRTEITRWCRNYVWYFKGSPNSLPGCWHDCVFPSTMSVGHKLSLVTVSMRVEVVPHCGSDGLGSCSALISHLIIFLRNIFNSFTN